MAARWDTGAQVRALEALVKASADASPISKTGTSITARNLAAGRPEARTTAPPPRRGRRGRTLARSSKRHGHGRGTSCSVRGSSSSLVSRVKIANLEARRGSPLLSALSIPLRMRSWQAGKLISLLLSVRPLVPAAAGAPGGRGLLRHRIPVRRESACGDRDGNQADGPGRAGQCVTSGRYIKSATHPACDMRDRCRGNRSWRGGHRQRRPGRNARDVAR